MRYSDRITFERQGAKVYNPKTSRYELTNSIRYENIPCNLSPLSRQRTALEYGDVKRDINIVRLQGQFLNEVTHAYIGQRQYLIVDKIVYMHDTVYYIEEVN
ncbi:hypothetical protein [Staphylococcus hsinchuensis]|uniref:Uncharacterized protein n=1 Tax=Staphylococcus hsinchuensis TaxID=3051183 RepID=A0ABZ3E9Q9_9STAP